MAKSIKVDDYTDDLIAAALAEDIGTGDVTTNATIHKGQLGRAELSAKESFVVCGLPIAEKVFKAVDKRLKFKALIKEGRRATKGTLLARVSGSLRSILTAERVALNFFQRLSGIATLTDKFAKKTARTKTRILDTRKTTPCMRILERYAVTVGGGENHRFGLFDAVLIKDNHIKAAGSIQEAVVLVRKAHKDKFKVEVETTTLKQVREAAAANVDIIMLDNMAPMKIKKAVAIVDGIALTEISGGVRLDNIAKVAGLGADYISIGALTHSAVAVDISLNIR
ncbi:MAG: carboxylating nicotinate-nucleotide diphosphorylase [Deltaproteobacteria bacterium]|nr:carboxylating nicotinate-nucleotide diphosphorylase [Deltaproteobacteria bacterium]